MIIQQLSSLCDEPQLEGGPTCIIKQHTSQSLPALHTRCEVDCSRSTPGNAGDFQRLTGRHASKQPNASHEGLAFGPAHHHQNLDMQQGITALNAQQWMLHATNMCGHSSSMAFMHKACFWNASHLDMCPRFGLWQQGPSRTHSKLQKATQACQSPDRQPCTHAQYSDIPK